VNNTLLSVFSLIIKKMKRKLNIIFLKIKSEKIKYWNETFYFGETKKYLWSTCRLLEFIWSTPFRHIQLTLFVSLKKKLTLFVFGQGHTQKPLSTNKPIFVFLYFILFYFLEFNLFCWLLNLNLISEKRTTPSMSSY